MPDSWSEEDRALVDFTRDLVRTPSVLGGEEEMAKRVCAEMRFLGFDQVEVDNAGNAVGIVEGRRMGPTVVLDAHMDTVDVHPRRAWTHDPFGGELEDGRIYGRGSADMKGALAAMVHAAGDLDRSRLAGRVVVSASVGEELIEGAALRAVMQRYGADFVVIGEPSSLDLARAGRGRAEFVVRANGRPSHASSPEQGINAVHVMRRMIEEIEKLPMPEDPFVGRGVMCLTDIISIPHPAQSVVPSGCRATYERRLVPGDERDAVLEELRGACESAGAVDFELDLARTDYTTYTGIRWDHPKWFAPWELDEEHDLVQGALRGLREAGLDPSLRAYQFCTNAAYSAGDAGVPTIGFGPSHEAMAHVVDEYLEVEELLAARRGYRGIVEAVLTS